MSILVQGQPAPSFSLPKTGGGNISSADFAGRQLVLFFYPKADTSACTLESIDFSGLAQAFAAVNTELLGISADSPLKQENFRKKHDLTVPLISDEAHKLIDAFGIWVEKQLYGRKYMGIERTTIIICPDAKVIKIFPKVKADGHAEQVLESLSK